MPEWKEGSRDYSEFFFFVFENYMKDTLEENSYVRRAVMFSNVNKHFREYFMGDDEEWFSRGAAWEDEYFLKVPLYKDTPVRNLWVVKGVYNRPSPDFEAYSVNVSGVAHRLDLLSKGGKLRWNGHGKVFSEEETLFVTETKSKWNAAPDADRARVEALGRSYTSEEYRAMANYFRKCMRLTYGRTCLVCKVGVDTVPVWALNGRVCRGCLIDNLASNVVLYQRHNIDVRLVLPYIVGKVWFFQSVHQALYSAKNFTADVVDFQVDHVHTKWNHSVPDIYVWMPHLRAVLPIPDYLPTVPRRGLLVDGHGSAFDPELTQFVKFKPSMLDGCRLVVQGMAVIPRGLHVQKEEAGLTIAASIRAFAVRYRYATLGKDEAIDRLQYVCAEMRATLLICYRTRTPDFDRVMALDMFNDYIEGTAGVGRRIWKVMRDIVVCGTMRIASGAYKADRSSLVRKVRGAEAMRSRRPFKLEYPGGYHAMTLKERVWFDKHSNYLGDPVPLDDDDSFFYRYSVYKPRMPYMVDH